MQCFTRSITLKDDQTWDALISSSPQGSIFLRSDVLSVWVASDPALHLVRFGCFDQRNRLVAGQAFIYKQKAFGVRVQTRLNISYACSPLLDCAIAQGSPEYFAIMESLARQVEKAFLFFKIECHPSLHDLRPLLQRAWTVSPEYAHTWDVSDPESLLERLKHKHRFHHAAQVFERLVFADETGPGIVEEFINLYCETSKHYQFKMTAAWQQAFRQRVAWMLDQDLIRFYTCRNKNGALLGVANYVFDHDHQTCYGWLLAYDLSRGEKDFLSALYLYAIQNLAGKFLRIDIAEGIRPELYDFKDSLGTNSTRFYLAETPTAQSLGVLYKSLRKLKTRVTNLFSVR